jgi:hypothetical protein
MEERERGCGGHCVGKGGRGGCMLACSHGGAGRRMQACWHPPGVLRTLTSAASSGEMSVKRYSSMRVVGMRVERSVLRLLLFRACRLVGTFMPLRGSSVRAIHLSSTPWAAASAVTATVQRGLRGAAGALAGAQRPPLPAIAVAERQRRA